MLYAQWERFRHRCIWTWEGWVHAWRHEPSLRQWLVANLISGALALWLPLSPAERALLLGGGIMVLAVEMLNSAIERAVDYTSKETHPLAKQAKDMASAAVAISAIAVGVMWLVVLLGLAAA